jgi:hypothetical protein
LYGGYRAVAADESCDRAVLGEAFGVATHDAVVLDQFLLVRLKGFAEETNLGLRRLD